MDLITATSPSEKTQKTAIKEVESPRSFRTFSTSFIYKQNLSRIWDIMKDVKKTSIIFEEFEPKIEFINGNNSYIEGNEFKVSWKGIYNLIIKVILFKHVLKLCLSYFTIFITFCLRS